MRDEKTVIHVSTREGYDRWAAIYDDEPNPTTWLDARELPALWPALAGRQVIELGCGTGRVLGPLRERGAIVTGVDFAPGMLQKAAAKHPDARLVLHDLGAPPLPLTPPPSRATKPADQRIGGTMRTKLIVSRAPETERD